MVRKELTQKDVLTDLSNTLDGGKEREEAPQQKDSGAQRISGGHPQKGASHPIVTFSRKGKVRYQRHRQQDFHSLQSASGSLSAEFCVSEQNKQVDYGNTDEAGEDRAKPGAASTEDSPGFPSLSDTSNLPSTARKFSPSSCSSSHLPSVRSERSPTTRGAHGCNTRSCEDVCGAAATMKGQYPRKIAPPQKGQENAALGAYLAKMRAYYAEVWYDQPLCDSQPEQKIHLHLYLKSG